jgi:hypothetical protein
MNAAGMQRKLRLVIQEQMQLLQLATRRRVPLTVRKAMENVIDHAWREVYTRRRHDRKVK